MNETKVLANVNGKEITDEDVHVFLNQLNPQIAAQFRTPEGINKIADELINQELLYLDAIANGLDNEEAFKAELEKVKANILKQYAMNKLILDINSTEEEVTKFYNEHKEHFQTPERVRASHILVKEEEQSKEIANEIKEGLTFEKAAEKYSICPSKEKGGDLGEFGRGQMVPEFEKVAFIIEEGKISEPVKTEFGYHLIKVVNKKESGISPLEEVKDKISQQVIAMKQQERYLNKTEELKNKYKVETYF